MLFLKFNVLLVAWLIYLLNFCVCISIGNLRDLPNFELTCPGAPSWGGLGCFFKCTWQGKHLTVFCATGTSPGQVESHSGFAHNQGCLFPSLSLTDENNSNNSSTLSPMLQHLHSQSAEVQLQHFSACHRQLCLFTSGMFPSSSPESFLWCKEVNNTNN